MSVSASIGGTVPPPPPGPAAAALPPGSAARALHVELPSQQVTLRARGARKGIPWAAGCPRASGRAREVAGRTRRADELLEGEGSRDGRTSGDPAVRPRRNPALGLGCAETEGSPWNSLAPEPGCHRAAGDSLAETLPSPV